MTDVPKEQRMLYLLEAIHTQVKYNYLIKHCVAELKMTDVPKEQIMLYLLEAIHTQVKYNYLIKTLCSRVKDD